MFLISSLQLKKKRCWITDPFCCENREATALDDMELIKDSSISLVYVQKAFEKKCYQKQKRSDKVPLSFPMDMISNRVCFQYQICHLLISATLSINVYVC